MSDFGCRISGASSQPPALATFSETPEIRHPKSDILFLFLCVFPPASPVGSCRVHHLTGGFVEPAARPLFQIFENIAGLSGPQVDIGRLPTHGLKQPDLIPVL